MSLGRIDDKLITSCTPRLPLPSLKSKGAAHYPSDSEYSAVLSKHLYAACCGSLSVTDSPHRPRSAKPRRGPRQRCDGGLPCPDLREVCVHRALACAAAEGKLVPTWGRITTKRSTEGRQSHPCYMASRIAAVKKRVDNVKMQYFGALCRGRVERLERRIPGKSRK